MQNSYLVIRKLHWARSSKRIGGGWYTIVLFIDGQNVLESQEAHLEPARELARQIGKKLHLEVVEDHSEARSGQTQ